MFGKARQPVFITLQYGIATVFNCGYLNIQLSHGLRDLIVIQSKQGVGMKLVDERAPT